MKSETSGKSSFLPDFCGVRMVFVVVLIAELLAIVLTLNESTFFIDGSVSLAFNSLFIQWMALFSVAVLCISRPYLSKLSDHWAATLSYLLVLVICLILTETAWWLSNISAELGKLISGTHTAFLVRSMGISAIVSALALRYFFIQHQLRRNIESEAEARIQALQARIRPHFLFNCMNIIASLTRTQPRLAEETIEDLSDLFRGSLGDAKQLVTLEEEFSLCRRYLRIEAHRLGKRLQVNWDTSALPTHALVPALTLQPLLENAIYHGIEPHNQGGKINISGTFNGKKIIICIDNPIPPVGYTAHHEGNQLAQDNTQQRISAYYGSEGKLEIKIINDRYRVELTLPYHVENSDS
jgi:two-component system, LytTR family, sensor histidine kinase AlgZ